MKSYKYCNLSSSATFIVAQTNKCFNNLVRATKYVKKKYVNKISIQRYLFIYSQLKKPLLKQTIIITHVVSELVYEPAQQALFLSKVFRVLLFDGRLITLVLH